MRVLITGSSGQIGTNLALACLAAGHEVFGIDCRANPWTDAYGCALGDLAGAAPARLFDRPGAARPDAVVHLAAHAKVHELVQDPSRAHANVAMTQHVLEHCRRRAIPLVYASSREVYGNAIRAVTTEDDAGFADAASSYAAGKIASEAMIYAYARCYGLPYLVVRLSNVYGRYDNDLARMERVVPLFIERIGSGAPVTVFGAEKVLDFTHVDDCVAGLLAGIERLVDGRVRDRTVNLARGEGHSLLQLAGYVGEALGRTPEVIVAPPQVGEVIRYVADLARARALLGYSPQVGLRDGVRRAVAWAEAWSQRDATVLRSGAARR
jgi:UDP-glucuronate 4-epimerase